MGNRLKPVLGLRPFIVLLIMVFTIINYAEGKPKTFPCFACRDEYDCVNNLSVEFCELPQYDSCETHYLGKDRREVLWKGCGKGFGCRSIVIKTAGDEPSDGCGKAPGKCEIFACNCIGPLCNGNTKRFAAT